MIRTYKYYTPGPVNGHDVVMGQINLARDYYRASLAKTLERQSRFREMAGPITDDELTPVVREMKRINVELDAIKDERNRRRIEAASKVIDDGDLKAMTKELNGMKKDLSEIIKQIKEKRKSSPMYQYAKLASNDLRKQHGRELRSEYGPRGKGLHCQTYLLVDDAVDTQCKKRAGCDIRFGSVGKWGSLSIGPDTNTKIGVSEFMTTGHPLLYIVVPDPETFWSRPNRQRRAVIHAVIGPGGRKGTWVEFPILLHRPLPENGVIKNVRVCRSMSSGRARWSIQFVVDVPEPEPTKGDVVGVDLGWRYTNGSRRVAMTYRAVKKSPRVVENHDELKCPESAIRRFEAAKAMKSEMDLAFNEIRAKISQEKDSFSCDDVLHIDKWRSRSRLRRFIQRWISGTETVSSELESLAVAWAREDLKRDRIWRGTLRRASNIRNKAYEQYANNLIKGTNAIAFEDLNGSDMARAKVAGEGRGQAAPFLLRSTIEDIARRCGVRTITVPAAYTSQMCPRCTSRLHYEDKSDITAYCPTCNTVMDRDEVGSYNIWSKAFEWLGGDQIPDTARRTESS